MIYNIYIKGVAENGKCASGYYIYDSDGEMLVSRRKDTSLSSRMPTTSAHFCNELLAAKSAVMNECIPEGAEVRIFSNDRAVCSWINNLSASINEPQNEYYRQFWKSVLGKHLQRPIAEYIGRGDSKELDALRAFTLTNDNCKL